jgi:hypothetical protein
MAQAAAKSSSNRSVSQDRDASSKIKTETSVGKDSTENTRSPVNPYQKKTSSSTSSPAQSILRRSLANTAGSHPSSSPSKQNLRPGLDKSFALKKGLLRDHIHRYDLRILIKKGKLEDDDHANTLKALQRFQDIMLQADPNTIIPPYFELDRSDNSVPDLTATYKVSTLDSLASVKRYFLHLSPHNEHVTTNIQLMLAGFCTPISNKMKHA